MLQGLKSDENYQGIRYGTPKFKRSPFLSRPGFLQHRDRFCLYLHHDLGPDIGLSGVGLSPGAVRHRLSWPRNLDDFCDKLVCGMLMPSTSD